MNTTLRAKFRITSVAGYLDSEGRIKHFEIKGNAVAGAKDENKQWSIWTPGGELTMYEGKQTSLLPGQEVFLDLMPMPEAPGVTYETGGAPILRLTASNRTFGGYAQESVVLTGPALAGGDHSYLYHNVKLTISNPSAIGALVSDVDYTLVVTPA